MPKDKKKNRKHGKTLAQRADKYDLYQQAVQVPEHEVEFFDRVYRKTFDRRAQVLREDFCGTFAICCDWAKSRSNRLAIGVDLDDEPLDWGRRHNLAKLKPAQQERVRLVQADVRAEEDVKADIIAAENFSFWIFRTRPELREYFAAARRNLAPEGIFVLDMMGGAESMEEDREDHTEYDGFTYVWDQARFDPITHDSSFYIHFEFDDGSAMRRAFEYHWRFWTLPEVQELLREAGYRKIDVYWEGTDSKTGEGNGVYRIREHAENDTAWICYVVATK
ncbi:MAG: SAM-dependent methyltransferase [Phycisphaeraceae bacterium]|nr:SAM-dependent methyltransferase [Phycisphaeraceae bacterium]